jgi:hypothetical protein
LAIQMKLSIHPRATWSQGNRSRAAGLVQTLLPPLPKLCFIEIYPISYAPTARRCGSRAYPYKEPTTIFSWQPILRVDRSNAPSRWRDARRQPRGLLALVGVKQSFRRPAIYRCNPKNTQLH